MPRYLDPKADVVFKRIFADHKHLLISFLNAILPLPADRPIVDLSYLSPEQIPDIPAFKRTIADVKCQDSSGRAFIVEMQIDWTNSFKERLLFGTSQALVRQMKKGQKYHLLQPVYGLGIVADSYTKEGDWYHHYKLVKIGESQEHSDVIEHLQLIFIELPKFPVQSPNEKKLKILWLRFLREINEDTRTVPPELLEVPEISEAIALTEQAAYTEGQLEAYNQYWDAVSTERTRLSDKYREGLMVGEASGIAKGIKQGLEQGVEQGAQLASEKFASRLFTKGMSDEEIAIMTDLPIEKVKELRQRGSTD